MKHSNVIYQYALENFKAKTEYARYAMTSMCDAITKPHVLPLACLAARAVIKYRFSYTSTDYLPDHIVSFISMHDEMRADDDYFIHEFFKDAEPNITAAVVECEMFVPV